MPGILFFTVLALVTSSEPDCAECHHEIAAAYAKTGMARSFQPATNAPHFTEPGSGLFQPFERDGRPGILRKATSGIAARDVTVDYAVGSGDHGITYLHRTRDNKLLELPITWYAEEGGHWGMSPGYDRPAHPGFSRPATYRCIFCHNGYLKVPGGYAEIDGATVFPRDLPNGIDCQRCHGSGITHADAVRTHKSVAEIRSSIINPARLTTDRQLDICMQCHLETTSQELPGAIMKFDRRVFSYRPGEPLKDYMQYFDHAPNTGHDDKLEIVSQAYRLRQSACFLKSQGRLTCTTCHNPHETAAIDTNRVCAECHQPHTAQGSCVACHMPKRQASDAIHIAITDHRIARNPAPQITTVEENESNTPPYKGTVVAYYPIPADPLYLAAANKKLLKSAFPESYYRAGYFEQALKLDPHNWRYIYGAGQASMDVSLLEQAAVAAPWETNILEALGAAYVAQGRVADAIRTFHSATEHDPEDPMAFSNLGSALLQAGDRNGAEKAFREAIWLLPEVPQLRDNLRRLRESRP